MKIKFTKGEILDRRPGYQRQAEEPEIITCECGAKVKQGLNGLVHIGSCSKGDDQ